MLRTVSGASVSSNARADSLGDRRPSRIAFAEYREPGSPYFTHDGVVEVEMVRAEDGQTHSLVVDSGKGLS